MVVVAATAIFVILVCLCSISKANLLSKNKELQQTPVTQVSPACRQKCQRQNLAQQILSAQTPHVQWQAILVCFKEEAQINYHVYVYHMCNIGSAMGTGQQPILEPNSSAEKTALICTSTFEEWHALQSTSSWSCVVAVMPTFTCQKESCDLCKRRRGLLEETTLQALAICLSFLLPARRQVTAVTKTMIYSLAPLHVLNYFVPWIRLGRRQPYVFSWVLLQVDSSGFNTNIMILISGRERNFYCSLWVNKALWLRMRRRKGMLLESVLWLPSRAGWAQATCTYWPGRLSSHFKFKEY